MKGEVIPLTMVAPNREAILVSILGGRGLRSRLTDMGLNEGVRLRVLHSRGWGSIIILTNNMRLVLGYGVAQKIFVQPVSISNGQKEICNA